MHDQRLISRTGRFRLLFFLYALCKVPGFQGVHGIEMADDHIGKHQQNGQRIFLGSAGKDIFPPLSAELLQSHLRHRHTGRQSDTQGAQEMQQALGEPASGDLPELEAQGS